MARFTRRWPSPIAALALVVALAACATPSADPTPTAPTRTTADSSPVAASGSEPDNSERIAALWQDVHDQRLDQVHDDSEPDGAAFDGLATDDTTGVLLDHIRAARSDVPSELAGVEHWPQVDVSPSGDSADISDCVIVAVRPAAQPDAEPTARSQVWTGTAAKTDDRWVLDSVSVGVDNCVAPELDRELLDAYREWHRAKQLWWNPPDPDHPRLNEVMVDPGLSDMRSLLADHRSKEIVVRDEHDLNNAVVFELGIGTARISDCFPAHPGNVAAYDRETDERREDLSPSPTPGQLDRTVLDVERSADGTWVANGWRSTTDSDCTPGGTPYAVAP